MPPVAGARRGAPLRDQFEALYVFDALVFNEGRTMNNLLYDTNNWQVLLVGHDRDIRDTAWPPRVSRRYATVARRRMG